jgi:hypothetical protein
VEAMQRATAAEMRVALKSGEWFAMTFSFNVMAGRLVLCTSERPRTEPRDVTKLPCARITSSPCGL